jgi:NADPH-dependent ferric siderophore reductase
VTLGGSDLARLEFTGLDQVVRFFFPREGQDHLWMPTFSNDAWIAQALLRPKSRRSWIRNYTIRRYRPADQEIDIEFVLHPGGGPASTWAANARAGDPAGIFDEGVSYLPPAHARWQLLVGEESAVPAILGILEKAHPDLKAEVFLEIPSSADIRHDIIVPGGARVHWVAREDNTLVPGATVLGVVKEVELPVGPFYTWVAGESALPTGLRRHLVNDLGVPKSDISFIGYWKHGKISPG